ncbi:MAG: PIN domain-containing protein [Treponema sp.]|nr:PIN domain-containing protein [Treponema sp.]
MKYLLDTNIISYLLQKNSSIQSKLKALIDEDDCELYISAVTYYELKRGLIASKATTKLHALQVILHSYFEVVLMDFDMYERSAQIYADLKNTGKLIEDDDIFIGATTIENDAVLITNNEQYLGRIKDLRYEVWA